MFSEEFCFFLLWFFKVCMRFVFYFELFDVNDFLCLEIEVLELDGMIWVVGRVINDRLGLKDNVLFEVE